MYYREKRNPVKQGLAYTPAMMDKMRVQGIPIQSNNLPEELFDDGDKTNSYDVPLYRQRGIDVADVWIMEQESKSKLKQFAKKQQQQQQTPV